MSDPSRTVRYYAALQMSGLDAEMGKLAVPVLRQILAQEKDADLVDRAKLRAHALGSRPPSAGAATTDAQRNRASHHGRSPRPARHGAPARRTGSTCASRRRRHQAEGLHQPAAWAGGDRCLKSLPADAKADLRREGYDPETFWARLRQLGPSEIISIEGDEGERIQIWTEE